MKLNNILYDLITEQLKQDMFNAVMKKWYGNEPTDQQIEQGKDYVDKFFILKNANRLKLNSSPIKTFLLRFDGNPFPKFESNRVPDITAYNLEQIQFLLNEFYEGINTAKNEFLFIPAIFRQQEGEKDLATTPERIEASKDLWHGKNYLILDDNGFRVYFIPTKKVSQMFGFFQDHVSERQWCVTYASSTGNYWQSYRSTRGRTFYFIIDESKNPEIIKNSEINKYYISTLQSATDSDTGFRLTSKNNDGEVVMTEEQIFKIYPKLRGHINLIKHVPFRPDVEIPENTDKISLINEDENSHYAFFKQNAAIRTQYIQNRGAITKKISWDVMNHDQRRQYVILTDRNDLFIKFSTKEIVDAVRNSESEYNLLNEKMKKEMNYSVGFNYLVYYRVIHGEFIPHRMSINSKNVIIVRDPRTRKYGIYNIDKDNWHAENGIEYSKDYDLSKTKALYNSKEPNKRYVVEIFTKGGDNPSNNSFVSIYSVSSTPSVKGHFMSYNSYLNFKENFDEYSGGDEKSFNYPDELETHSDIKELGQ